MLDKMHKAIDKGLTVGVVFHDRKNGFDTMFHNTLIRKLSSIDFADRSRCCTSYLSNRLQTMKIDSVLSDLKPISHRVPQGSIQGQFLFRIYMSDLCNIFEFYGIWMHAHNTVVFFFERYMDEVHRSILHDMQCGILDLQQVPQPQQQED